VKSPYACRLRFSVAIVLMVFAALGTERTASAAQCTYEKWEIGAVRGPCCGGTTCNGCCAGNEFYTYKIAYDCATGQAINSTGSMYCETVPGSWPPPTVNHCGEPGCDPVVGEAQPGTCNGSEPVPAAPADQGCGDDENKCSDSDRDPFPVRFSTGRVETRPLTLLSLPSPAGIFFGYRLHYNSSNNRSKAQAVLSGETRPFQHLADDDIHSPGERFMDNFQDRLVFTGQIASVSGITSWARADGMTSFNGSTSTADKFELIDRGVAVTVGRFVVRSRDGNSVRRIWTFDPVTYVDNLNVTRTFGRLRRVALTDSLTNFVGYYGYDINWNTTTKIGTIDSVTDTYGRQILVNRHRRYG
jgi:hypothetical protein